jgi:tetratricopeptide (TPR) repeat protein
MRKRATSTWLYIAVILPLLALALAVGWYVSRGSPHENAKAAYARGNQFRIAHNPRSARIEMLRAVKADPKWTQAQIGSAEVSLDLFQGAAALASLERAVALGADQRKIQHLLGHAQWLLGDLEKAEAVLTDGDIPRANLAYANRILGRVYMDMGNIDEAQNAFARALKVAPKDSQTWTEVARFRFVIGNEKAAIEAADYAVSLDNFNVRAIEFRGRLTSGQFGLTAAIPWFERGLQIDPNDVPTLTEYAATLGEMGHYTLMLEQVRKIIALDSKNGRAFYMQAVLAARAGDYAMARRILQLAGPAVNALPGAMLVSGVSEYEMGNWQQAINIFTRLVLTQPNNLEHRKLLARAMYRAGRHLDALDEIKAVAARPDADTYSLMLAGRAFEASGNRSKAAAGINEAAKPYVRRMIPVAEPLSLPKAAAGAQQNPNSPRHIIPYIRSLMLERNYEAAYEVAARLQSTNPGVANAHIMVGDVEMARGRVLPAIEAYKKARPIQFSQGLMLRLVDGYTRANNISAAQEVLTSYLYFNPTSQSAQRFAAFMFLDGQQYGQAVPFLENLLVQQGYNDSVLLANLARAYSGLNLHDAAIERARIAYLIDPANPMVTHVYGQVLLKSGKRPKAARQMLEKAAVLMPGDKLVLAELAKARGKKASVKKKVVGIKAKIG